MRRAKGHPEPSQVRRYALLEVKCTTALKYLKGTKYPMYSTTPLEPWSPHSLLWEPWGLGARAVTAALQGQGDGEGEAVGHASYF
jgi:hypothetical protein